VRTLNARRHGIVRFVLVAGASHNLKRLRFAADPATGGPVAAGVVDALDAWVGSVLSAHPAR